VWWWITMVVKDQKNKTCSYRKEWEDLLQRKKKHLGANMLFLSTLVVVIGNHSDEIHDVVACTKMVC